jgi:hypothetical protein
MKTCFFSLATDETNMGYYKMMRNSLKKFHPDIPHLLYDKEKIKKYLDDPMWMYRSSPSILYELRNDYDLIIQINADQIVTGPLDEILKGDYELGVVYNYNRVDPTMYGAVSVLDIPNQYYYNLGTVAVHSKALIEHWYRLCYTYHFMNYRYREQDLVNIMAYYGNYKVKCFDEVDPKTKDSSYYGLKSKGEWHKAIMRDDKLILPRAEDGYPERDKILRILHWAGGDAALKMNYRTYFSQPCIIYLDWLTADTKLTYKQYVKSRK